MKRIALALLLLACTDEGAATRTLEASGFRDVNIGTIAWFACGKDDWSATSFDATNPAGKRVHGAVCCGLWFKACTVRF